MKPYFSEWRARAWEILDEVRKSLPADATLDDHKRATAAQAWYAHQGTSWGKKVWGQARREYLQRLGQAPRLKPRPIGELPMFAEAA